MRDRSGRLLPLADAISEPSRVAAFVQAPGRYNALGEFRFNIRSSDSIYLHDTSDRQNFYDGSSIMLSHGCVRVEDPRALARWLLNADDEVIDELKRDGSTRDVPIGDTIPVTLGYFTAWPSPDGSVTIYDDIYNREDEICG